MTTRKRSSVLTKKKISIVPIAYADEGNIEELHKRVTKVMKKVAPNYEIIYVNDASPDNSQKVLEKLTKRDKKLTVIKHSRNFGGQNAFTTGMKHALGDAVVLMDGDLQEPPELIPEFIKKWKEGYDVVYGYRTGREASFGKFWETFYHKFYVYLNKLSYVKMPLDSGEFSLMDRKVVDQINALPERDRFIRCLRAWVGFNQVGVPYIRQERFWGKGVAANNIVKRRQWALKALINFSNKPLDWVFSMAFYTALASLLAIVVHLVLYFTSSKMPRGYLTLLTAILFFGSIQMITLSIISEYLKRIFEEVKDRPYAITEKIINNHRKTK